MEIRADIQGSTLLEEVGPRDFLRFDYVPMRRFDRLFTSFARPALCKIDVQGAELMVLEGMVSAACLPNPTMKARKIVSGSPSPSYEI